MGGLFILIQRTSNEAYMISTASKALDDFPHMDDGPLMKGQVF
jgi:hypothetical protein